MSQKTKRLAVGIQAIIMIATIGVTFGLVHLLGGGLSDRPGEFWVTMSGIIFAELLVFNIPMIMTATDSTDKRSFPFHLTASTFALLYAGGVAIATLAFLGGAEMPVLLSIHMVLLLLLGIGMGMYFIGGSAIADMDQAEKKARGGYQRIALHFRSISDRATMLEGSVYEPVKAAIQDLSQEVEHATGESLPGSESADAEISAGFGRIEALMMELEDAGEGEEGEALAKKAQREIQLVKLAVARREDLMKTLR